MFQGASSLSLDGKGRLSVPTRHRDVLLATAQGQLTITRHPHGCLMIFPRPEWEKFRERIAALPQLPTSTEQGLPAFQIGGWSAVVGPKGLAADQVKRIHAAVVAAYSTAEVREAMARQGNTLLLNTPEVTQALFRSELARYAALVKKAGVVAQ